MRLKAKLLVLPAASLCLTMFGAGCDNASVNESKAPGGETSAGAVSKDSQPPPTSVKEYYERTQKSNPSAKGGKVAKPKEKETAPAQDKEAEKN